MFDNILTEEKVQELRALIGSATRIVTTCHVSPDGDAMGSLLAMTSYLRRQGKAVTPVVPNLYPDFLRWMPGASDVLVYDKHEAEVEPVLRQADLFVCLDFNSQNRLLGMEPLVRASQAPKVMIDHHLDPEDFCCWTLSCNAFSSTCELLYGVLYRLEGADTLTHDEAVCIYTGMMTDTGCFSYNSNRSEIYHIIGSLVDKGIDKDKIYRNVFYNYSADRFRLMGYMLYVKLEVMGGCHAAIMSLTRNEQRRFSHKKGDTEGIVNMPLQIAGMRLSVLLREDTERNVVRVSLRSVDDFPCNAMAAEYFHGGGHLNAAGGELECTMEQAMAQARKAIKAYAHLLNPQQDNK